MGLDAKKTDRRNLILLAIAKYISGFASYIYDVGIVIYLFSSTQSVEIIGGFFVSQLLPAIIILFTGKVIDTHSKKKLLAAANLLKSVIFVMLLFSRNIWVIYAVTFLMNLILEFESNTLSAFMVNAFSKDRLLKTSSIINLLDSASLLIAPTVAALIAMKFQIQINIFIVIILFLFVAVCYLFIETSGVNEANISQETESQNGWKDILKDRNVIKTIVYWNIFMLCIGLAAPLEISMIEDTLEMPSAYYGFGNTVEGVGMVLASVFILGIIRKMKPMYIISIGLFSAAASYLMIGISQNIWMYFVGACLVGMTATFCPLGFKTEIQMKCDPATVGRTFTIGRFTILLSRAFGSLVVGKILLFADIRVVYYGICGILLAEALWYKRYRKKV